MPTEGSLTTQPFAHCSMDLITDLPPVDGFDSILAVVNQGLMLLFLLLKGGNSHPLQQGDHEQTDREYFAQKSLQKIWIT